MIASARPLTARQEEILGFIRGHCDEKGYPPTYQDVVDAMGFKSKNSFTCHVRALFRKGAIERRPGVARCIVPKGWEPRSISSGIPDGPRQELTPLQLDALRAIERLVESRKIPPTFREIGEEAGLDPGNEHNAAALVRHLERKGYVARTPNVARSVRVLVPSSEAVL